MKGGSDPVADVVPDIVPGMVSGQRAQKSQRHDDTQTGFATAVDRRAYRHQEYAGNKQAYADAGFGEGEQWNQIDGIMQIGFEPIEDYCVDKRFPRCIRVCAADFYGADP